MGQDERSAQDRDGKDVPGPEQERRPNTNVEAFVAEARKAQGRLTPEEQGHFYRSPNLTSRYRAIAIHLSGESGKEILPEQIGIMLWYRGELSGDPVEYGMWVLEVPEKDIADDLWQVITGRKG